MLNETNERDKKVTLSVQSSYNTQPRAQTSLLNV